MDLRPFATAFDPATRTLRVAGAVEEAAGVSLREDLIRFSASYTTDLWVDLDEVEFLPSMAVGVIADALKQAGRAGSNLQLVARDGSIAQRVLAICVLPYRSLRDDSGAIS